MPRRGEEVERAVLRAAVDELTESGYDGFTMDRDPDERADADPGRSDRRDRRSGVPALGTARRTRRTARRASSDLSPGDLRHIGLVRRHMMPSGGVTWV